MHAARAPARRGCRRRSASTIFDPYYDVALKEARLARLAGRSGFRFERIDLADAEAHGAAVPRRRVHARRPSRRAAGRPLLARQSGRVPAQQPDGVRPRPRGLPARAASRTSSTRRAPASTARTTRCRSPRTRTSTTRSASTRRPRRPNELIAHSYSHLYRLPTTGLRFFTVYGPWGRPDMAPMLFTKAILAGEPIHVFNDGRMRRDFTYVDDIVEGVVAGAREAARRGTRPARRTRSTTSAITRRSSSRRSSRRSSGCSAGRRSRTYAPMQPGDVPATYAAIDRLAAVTGFRAAHAARRRSRALRRVVSRRTTGSRGLTPAPMIESASARARRMRRGLPNRLPRSHDSRHRRCRFHRRQLRARLARAHAPSRSSISTSSPTPATSATSRRSRGDARHVFVRGDIGDRALVDALLAQHRPRAIVNFAAESHVDRSIHGPAAFVETNVVGTFTLLEAARAYLVDAAGRRARGVPLPPRVDRRGLRLARPRRSAVHRDDAVRAEQSVLGVEGRVRSSGARLSPHLRTADADDQLLEQLRAAAVPGEADPADDRQRARRQAAAGLRRRPERPRLALRRRSLRGDSRGARRRAPGRDLQRRRQRGDDQPRRRARDLPDPGGARAGPRLRGRSSRSSGSSRARPALRDRRVEDPSASSAGRRRRRSPPACAAPCSGTSTTARGSPR